MPTSLINPSCATDWEKWNVLVGIFWEDSVKEENGETKLKNNKDLFAQVQIYLITQLLKGLRVIPCRYTGRHKFPRKILRGAQRQ